MEANCCDQLNLKKLKIKKEAYATCLKSVLTAVCVKIFKEQWSVTVMSFKGWKVYGCWAISINAKCVSQLNSH